MFSVTARSGGNLDNSGAWVASTTKCESLALSSHTWAMNFYRDRSLEVVGLGFRFEPLPFWLVTFKKPRGDEKRSIPWRCQTEQSLDLKMKAGSKPRDVARTVGAHCVPD